MEEGAMRGNVDYPVGIKYYDKYTKSVTPQVCVVLKDKVLPTTLRETYLQDILNTDIKYVYFGKLPTAQSYSQAG